MHLLLFRMVQSTVALISQEVSQEVLLSPIQMEPTLGSLVMHLETALHQIQLTAPFLGLETQAQAQSPVVHHILMMTLTGTPASLLFLSQMESQVLPESTRTLHRNLRSLQQTILVQGLLTAQAIPMVTTRMAKPHTQSQSSAQMVSRP